MKISNAIPVQFWLNGVPTFNGTEEDGIVFHCYNQQFNCADIIRLQLTDTVSRDYKLKILDVNGDLIETLSFIETASGGGFTYDLNFTPVEHGICNTKVSLQIIYNTASGACISYHVVNTRGDIHLLGEYFDCGGIKRTFDIANSGSSDFCAIEDTVTITFGEGAVSNVGPCVETTTTTTEDATTTTTTEDVTTTTTTTEIPPTTTTTTLMGDCRVYKIDNSGSGSPATGTYTPCGGTPGTPWVVNAGEINNYCAEPGTVSVDTGGPAVTDIGACS